MNEIDILEQHAVDAAINLQWDDAIKLNKEILELDKKNEAAYLRLGFSYLQKKDIQNAKKYYSKALKLSPKNTVAIQNMERIKVLEKGGVSGKIKETKVFNPELFLEIQGKTKTVSLVNLGQKKVLAELYVGEPTLLQIKKRRVEIRTESGEYIGSLPDDVSMRLMYFLKAKSVYSTYIKDATVTQVIIFIKEEKKGKAVMKHISFPLHIQKSMQTAILQSEGKEEAEGEENDEEEIQVEDWEKIANDTAVGEDKEALLGIQPELEEEEEEE